MKLRSDISDLLPFIQAAHDWYRDDLQKKYADKTGHMAQHGDRVLSHFSVLKNWIESGRSLPMYCRRKAIPYSSTRQYITSAINRVHIYKAYIRSEHEFDRGT